MNIFVLSADPMVAARSHCDRHVVKMIVEYAQLLSTAHRVLDGTQVALPVVGKNGKVRSKKIWVLPNEQVELVAGKPVYSEPFYAVSHINHPSNVWARESELNYHWLSSLWNWLCVEYEHRYGRVHATKAKLFKALNRHPRNIPAGELTPFALAMPDQYKVENDAVASYRNFYNGEKARFATWRKREAPTWFKGNGSNLS